MPYKFVVKGPPVVQQRFQIGKYGNRYDPSGKERKVLSEYLLVARMEAGKSVLKGFLALTVSFCYSRGIRGQQPDLSNMLKALEDSGNKILWEDDKQIIVLHAFKVEVAKGGERTEVEIEEL